MYECAGWLWVKESVRYITYDSCAISVVSPFNRIDEFQQYDLNIQYWPEAQTVILDLISYWFNFIEKNSANKVFLSALWRLDNVK